MCDKRGETSNFSWENPTVEIFDEWVAEGLEPPSRSDIAPVQWFGGKGNIASWIVSHLPRATTYVEPYCGAASVFWHLPPKAYPVITLNDLNGNIVNLFRVLQDPNAFRDLVHRLLWTPYSRAEFRRACEILKSNETEPVLRAWAFFVAQNQGFAGKGLAGSAWGSNLTKNQRGMVNMVSVWQTCLGLLKYWHNRLLSVQIDQRDALDCLRYWDTPDTLFYVDPPYHPDTRTDTKYDCDVDDAHYRALVEVLLRIQGKAVLSGYEHEVYRPLEEAGWRKLKFETACSAAGRVRGSKLRGKGAATTNTPRTECLWLSPRNRDTNDLFGNL